MKKAISLGYWGIAGIDIVIGEDNRVLVIDLNFRQNSSTGAVLLKESIMKSFNVNTLKLRTFKTNINYNKLEKYIRYLIKLKKLVPLSIYKPIKATHEITPLYLAVFLSVTRRKK